MWKELIMTHITLKVTLGDISVIHYHSNMD